VIIVSSMNIYALLPLIATIAYVPLLVTVSSCRPWQKRHTLFMLFIIPALLHSLADFLCRGLFFPEYSLLLGKIIVVMYAWFVVQFHLFTSSFYAPNQKKWRVFAYSSLVMIISMAGSSYMPREVAIIDGEVYPDYGPGMILFAIPLLTLGIRNLVAFTKRLKVVDDPVLYNQIYSMRLCYIFLVIFAAFPFIPYGKEFPLSHFGNLINAFILSFATLRHQLVDIKTVLRQGLAWVVLGTIGVTSYILLIFICHYIFNFQVDFNIVFIATLSSICISILVYKLRNLLFTSVGKFFQGEGYNYQHQLLDFSNKIHNIFSLKDQGEECLSLITKSVNCKKASLLFPDSGSEDFTTQFAVAKGEDQQFLNLKLRENNPVTEYLKRERKTLTRESLVILPEFRSIWKQERADLDAAGIELFIPLVSRDKLIGIITTGDSQSGKYSLENLSLLEVVAGRVAVSMEKEYLQELLKECEAELSVINRSSTIITSSLNIQEIYDSFIMELKNVVDVSWAAITIAEENDIYFLALSSEIGSAWDVGERIPIKGTATDLMATYKKPIVEPDLLKETRFATSIYQRKQGVRSVAYLPLISKGRVLGSLVIASLKPDVYSTRKVLLLEQLASQIAMPVENSRLYAKTEEKARIDEVTGLLNRRCMDEMLASEISRHSRYGGIFSMILLDLDSFKIYNDTYGHPAGDKLLKKIGSSLKNTIRSTDQAFRYGGDEFAVILPQTPVDDAFEVSERIRKRIASSAGAHKISVTASLGISCWPDNGIDADKVITGADEALYNAKRNGSNQTQCSPSLLIPLNQVLADIENVEDEDSEFNTVCALAATVDTRDNYSNNHSKEVSKYTRMLAAAFDMENQEINNLENAALLHDVGKIGISDDILKKQGELTGEEWKTVTLHPQVGAAIVSRVKSLVPCVPAIMHHHENYDGSGYPQGLKGKEIPMGARILALADAFASITSEKLLHDSLSCDEALEQLKQNAGTKFDPYLVEVLISAMTVAPVSIKRKVRK